MQDFHSLVTGLNWHREPPCGVDQSFEAFYSQSALFQSHLCKTEMFWVGCAPRSKASWDFLELRGQLVQPPLQALHCFIHIFPCPQGLFNLPQKTLSKGGCPRHRLRPHLVERLFCWVLFKSLYAIKFRLLQPATGFACIF